MYHKKFVMLFQDQQVGKKGFDHPCLKSDCPKNQ